MHNFLVSLDGHSVMFYMFSLVLVVAALAVISVRNPVHSVLFLILAFFNAAGLFILLNAEFLAMLIIVVYVGAVAILFLFIVMMLNTNRAQGSTINPALKILFLSIAAVVAIESITLANQWKTGSGSFFASNFPQHLKFIRQNSVLASSKATNTELLGGVLYTEYFYLFQIAGLILLVAMVGVIVLVHKRRVSSKKQDVSTQLERNKKNSLTMTQPKIGGGV